VISVSSTNRKNWRESLKISIQDRITPAARRAILPLFRKNIVVHPENEYLLQKKKKKGPFLGNRLMKVFSSPIPVGGEVYLVTQVRIFRMMQYRQA
jgi:hypothetical protein